jgi:hypothetical protein
MLAVKWKLAGIFIATEVDLPIRTDARSIDRSSRKVGIRAPAGSDGSEGTDIPKHRPRGSRSRDRAELTATSSGRDSRRGWEWRPAGWSGTGGEASP